MDKNNASTSSTSTSSSEDKYCRRESPEDQAQLLNPRRKRSPNLLRSNEENCKDPLLVLYKEEYEKRDNDAYTQLAAEKVLAYSLLTRGLPPKGEWKDVFRVDDAAFLKEARQARHLLPTATFKEVDAFDDKSALKAALEQRGLAPNQNAAAVREHDEAQRLDQKRLRYGLPNDASKDEINAAAANAIIAARALKDRGLPPDGGLAALFAFETQKKLEKELKERKLDPSGTWDSIKDFDAETSAQWKRDNPNPELSLSMRLEMQDRAARWKDYLKTEAKALKLPVDATALEIEDARDAIEWGGPKKDAERRGMARERGLPEHAKPREIREYDKEKVRQDGIALYHLPPDTTWDTVQKYLAAQEVNKANGMPFSLTPIEDGNNAQRIKMLRHYGLPENTEIHGFNLDEFRRLRDATMRREIDDRGLQGEISAGDDAHNIEQFERMRALKAQIEKNGLLPQYRVEYSPEMIEETRRLAAEASGLPKDTQWRNILQFNKDYDAALAVTRQGCNLSATADWQDVANAKCSALTPELVRKQPPAKNTQPMTGERAH